VRQPAIGNKVSWLPQGRALVCAPNCHKTPPCTIFFLHTVCWRVLHEASLAQGPNQPLPGDLHTRDREGLCHCPSRAKDASPEATTVPVKTIFPHSCYHHHCPFRASTKKESTWGRHVNIGSPFVNRGIKQLMGCSELPQFSRLLPYPPTALGLTPPGPWLGRRAPSCPTCSPLCGTIKRRRLLCPSVHGNTNSFGYLERGHPMLCLQPFLSPLARLCTQGFASLVGTKSLLL
jgi:hypothetical protein